MSGLISLREAANISGYHPDYLSFLIRNNKLHGEKIGRAWCVREGELRKFILDKNNNTKNPQNRAGSGFNFLFFIFIILFIFLIIWLNEGENIGVKSNKENDFTVKTIYSETSSEVFSETSTKN